MLVENENNLWLVTGTERQFSGGRTISRSATWASPRTSASPSGSRGCIWQSKQCQDVNLESLKSLFFQDSWRTGRDRAPAATASCAMTSSILTTACLCMTRRRERWWRARAVEPGELGDLLLSPDLAPAHPESGHDQAPVWPGEWHHVTCDMLCYIQGVSKKKRPFMFDRP